MPATAVRNEHDTQRRRPRVQGRGRARADAVVAGERHLSDGPGRRVAVAFDAMDAYPALSESRDRLVAASGGGELATSKLAGVIESDIALAIAALRLANGRGCGNGRVETAVGAAGLLRPRTRQALASEIHTYDFFERVGVWGTAPERFRLHASATQRAANRIATEVDYPHRDRLAITSLLHDIGKLVLIHAYPGYPSHIFDESMTPSECAGRERAELGIDHGAIGAVLLLRWGLPVSLARAIEGHHNPDAGGEAALIRLADMLVHHEHGTRVSPHELLQSARAIGLGPKELRRLLYELPNASRKRQLPSEPCPLSRQEQRVLQQLGKGRVYKEIAHELGLSPSTVRSHLHNVYRKLGVANRAQAVLFASARGWL
jgi:DNA-binding CsgD family transcriptional regulator/HD-like signal output (HDOD) protein